MALLVFVGFILYMLITGGVKRDRIVTKDTVKKVEKPWTFASPYFVLWTPMRLCSATIMGIMYGPTSAQRRMSNSGRNADIMSASLHPLLMLGRRKPIPGCAEFWSWWSKNWGQRNLPSNTYSWFRLVKSRSSSGRKTRERDGSFFWSLLFVHSLVATTMLSLNIAFHIMYGTS